MASHSSVPAWRIPGTGEPGGLPSMGSQSRTRLKRLSSSSMGSKARCHQETFLINCPGWYQMEGKPISKIPVMCYGLFSSFPGSLVGKEPTCNAGDPGLERSAGEGIGYPLQYSQDSLVAQLVKNPPTMQETSVQFLGWEDPTGEGKGYPLQCSALENSMDCIVHGVTFSKIYKCLVSYL